MGHVYLFDPPPREDLPLVDIPMFTQAESASESLLVQIDDRDLREPARRRLRPILGQSHLALGVIRRNAGIAPAAQIRLARESGERAQHYHRLLAWSGSPSYLQLEAACRLIWDYLVEGRGRGLGVLAAAQNRRYSVNSPHEPDLPDGANMIGCVRAGGAAAVAAAEHLAEAGCRVVLVTPSMAVADDVDITNRVPLYRRLYERSVTMLPNSDVVRVDAQGVVVTNVYTGRESTISGIERVVVCNAAEACDELADTLRKDGLRVLMAGDSVSPREVDVPMAEGALAAREI